MKKKYIFAVAIAVLVALVSCGGSGGSSASKEYTETEVATADDDIEQDNEVPASNDLSIINRKKFLERFYEETFVIEDGMFDYEDEHLSCMSMRMIEMLRDNYDYDCEDGNCYAWWVFRDPSQDGPDVPTINIYYDEGDWFHVHYVGGETVDLKVRVEGDAQDITITGLKSPSQGIYVD